MSRTHLTIPLAVLALAASAAPANAWPTFNTEYPSTLVTCGESCESGMVVQATSLSRPLGHLPQPKMFQWYTSAPLDHVIYQVATEPFANSRSFEAEGLIAQSTIWTTTRSGLFDVNFGAVLEAAADLDTFKLSTVDDGFGPSGFSIVEPSFDPSILAPLAPKVFYVRMFPMSGTRRMGPASNTVVFTFEGPGQTFTPYVLQHAYDVQILEFDDIRQRSLPYGCVYVDYVPYWARNYPMYSTWYRHYQSGEPLCPSVYRGQGEPSWYESMWDFVSSGLSWVSTFYDDLKSDALAFIVNAVESTFRVEVCGEKCLERLEMGLDAALVTMGIPPELPDADRLINDGKAYLVETLAEKAGAEDCDFCKDKLRDAVDEISEMLVDKQVERLCGDVEAAHRNGREPLCVPALVSAHPAPESAIQPARVTVRVTRNYEHPELTVGDLQNYRLSLTNYAWSTVSATLRLPTATCYNDAGVFECVLRSFSTGGTLRGPLFGSIDLAIPPLAPGESLEIPFVLAPVDYFVPAHETYMNNAGTRALYNDWNHLYDDATMYLQAKVSCPAVTFGNNCNDTSTVWKSHMGR